MASKSYNFSSLSTNIQDEFAWRRKELHLIYDRIPLTKSPIQTALLRSALPLLYAHWEGFIKNIATHYLQFVSFKYLKHSELKPQFVALCLSAKINDLEIKSIQSKTKVVEFLFDELDKKAKIPHKKIINTRSNLRYEVLEEIFFVLGLDISGVSSNESLIDDLVDTRNHIAHGHGEIIDHETFKRFYWDIIDIMSDVKTIIENSAVTNSFMRV